MWRTIKILRVFDKGSLQPPREHDPPVHHAVRIALCEPAGGARAAAPPPQRLPTEQLCPRAGTDF